MLLFRKGGKQRPLFEKRSNIPLYFKGKKQVPPFFKGGLGGIWGESHLTGFFVIPAPLRIRVLSGFTITIF